MARSGPAVRAALALAALGGAVIACGGESRSGSTVDEPAAAEAAEPVSDVAEDELTASPEIVALVTGREIARLTGDMTRAARLLTVLDLVVSVHELVNAVDEDVRGGSTTRAIVLGLRKSGKDVVWEEGSSEMQVLGLRMRIHGDADPEDEGRDGDDWRCYAWPDEASRAGLCFVSAPDGAAYGTVEAPYVGSAGPEPGAALGEGGVLAPGKATSWRGADGHTWTAAVDLLHALETRLGRLQNEGLPEDELRAKVRETLKTVRGESD